MRVMVDNLLHLACRSAFCEFRGQKATADALEALGARAKEMVLMQADHGLWREAGIESSSKLSGIVCTMTVDAHGYVRPQWDWSLVPLTISHE